PTCTKCNKGYYYDKTNKCVTCGAGCETCDAKVDPIKCTECQAGYYMKENVCTECDATDLPNCAACSADGKTCTTCKAGHSLIAGKCTQCPSNSATCSDD